MKMDRSRYKLFPFLPPKAALIVIDMQAFFTDLDSHAYVPSSGLITKKINSLIEFFKKNERPVIFTRHIDVAANKLMNKWWRDQIKKNDRKSLLSEELDTSYGETLIKHSYDAFQGTRLEGILKKSRTTQVVITGVVTHLCCETTARSAFIRNFETFFVTDATASYSRRHHNAAILNLSHGFAVPVKCGEILSQSFSTALED